MTLTEFLLARIAEDEVQAHIARHDTCFNGIESPDEGAWYYCANPERRLAECDAKRRLVETLNIFIRIDGNGAGLLEPCAAMTSALVLAYLTLPYADHVDYQREWMP